MDAALFIALPQLSSTNIRLVLLLRLLYVLRIKKQNEIENSNALRDQKNLPAK